MKEEFVLISKVFGRVCFIIEVLMDFVDQLLGLESIEVWRPYLKRPGHES